MTWALIIGAMVAAVALIGYSLLAMSGKLDQAEEDEYGVELARRS